MPLVEPVAERCNRVDCMTVNRDRLMLHPIRAKPEMTTLWERWMSVMRGSIYEPKLCYRVDRRESGATLLFDPPPCSQSLRHCDDSVMNGLALQPF